MISKIINLQQKNPYVKKKSHVLLIFCQKIDQS
jgi:hypothetical protein